MRLMSFEITRYLSNGERSHAGPQTSDWNHDIRPALAGAVGWARKLLVSSLEKKTVALVITGLSTHIASALLLTK